MHFDDERCFDVLWMFWNQRCSRVTDVLKLMYYQNFTLLKCTSLKCVGIAWQRGFWQRTGRRKAVSSSANAQRISPQIDTDSLSRYDGLCFHCVCMSLFICNCIDSFCDVRFSDFRSHLELGFELVVSVKQIGNIFCMSFRRACVSLLCLDKEWLL